MKQPLTVIRLFIPALFWLGLSLPLLTLGSCTKENTTVDEDGNTEDDGNTEQDGGDNGNAGDDSDPTGGGEHIWSKAFLGNCRTEGRGVTTDSQGNVFVTGEIGFMNYPPGDVTVDDETITCWGSDGVYIGKFNPDGTKIWFNTYKANQSGGGRDVVTDSSSNVFVTGCYYNTINFGGEDLNAVVEYSFDTFVAKFDAEGNHVWSESLRTPDGCGRAIDLDHQGNVIVAGEVGSLRPHLFVTKLDADGTRVWSNSYAGEPDGYGDAFDVATDQAGNILVAGRFTGLLDFGTVQHESPGVTSYNSLVLKLNPDGDHVWSKSYGSGYGSARGISVDSGDNIYVLGKKALDAEVEGDSTLGNVFLVKYDSGGSSQWVEVFDDSQAHGIATDAQGNVIISGSVDDAVDFGGGTLPSPEYFGAYVAKYNSNGDYQWGNAYILELFGGYSLAVATSPDGSALVTGTITPNTTTNFGGDDFTTTNDNNTFLLKLEP
jgi:hypothetical protein